jgi:hypothetical protein
LYAQKLICPLYFLGDLTWIEFINNPINELSDDDDDYVPSMDTSFTSDDNNDFYDNVEFDVRTELKKNAREIRREYGWSSYDDDDSDLDENFPTETRYPKSDIFRDN